VEAHAGPLAWVKRAFEAGFSSPRGSYLEGLRVAHDQIPFTAAAAEPMDTDSAGLLAPPCGVREPMASSRL